MKKYYLLIALVLISFLSNAQSCYFTFVQTGSPNTFDFIPNNSPAIPNATIMWDFGDGSSMISPQATHTYAQSGIYTVTMSLFDSTNTTIACTFTQSITVSFCNVTYYQDSTNSYIYYFSNFTNGAISQVDWDFGDNTVGSGSTVSHQYGTPGIYNVICTETVNGVNFCTTSIIVQVGSNCSYQVISPGPNSPGYVKQFYAIIPSTSGIVSWDFGDGSPIIQGAVIQKSFANAGTYNVCMNYINGIDTCNYCSPITISSGPTGGNCNFTVNQTSNSTFDFVPSNINSGNTFEFNFGDSVTQTTTSLISHNYSSPGFYNVCMNEIDSNGAVLCSNCQPVVVLSPATNCQANFTFTNVGLDAYFINQSVANPSLGAPVSYTWNFGDGNTSSDAFPHHVYSSYGVYNVCLIVGSPNCTITYCDSILIDSTNNPSGLPCSAQFVFTQTSPYQISAVVLYPSNGYSYSWDFGDGSPLVNQLYTSHSYTNPGTYPVCLTMTSAFLGCTNIYCDTLTVDSLGNIIYKGINTGFTLQTTTPTILTGIENNSTVSTIQLQPNPAHNTITISAGAIELKNYVLISATGQQVESGSFASNVYAIDVSKLSKGVYLLKTIDNEGNNYNQRFLKD
jgi:PKD repeat protein